MAGKLTAQGAGILLVTANVGSLFEDVSRCFVNNNSFNRCFFHSRRFSTSPAAVTWGKLLNIDDSLWWMNSNGVWTYNLSVSTQSFKFLMLYCQYSIRNLINPSINNTDQLISVIYWWVDWQQFTQGVLFV